MSLGTVLGVAGAALGGYFGARVLTRAEVIADAHAWYGGYPGGPGPFTPYVHQQRKQHVGTDCIGIVGGIARDRGHADGIAWERDPEAHTYGKTPEPRKLVALADKYLERIRVSEIQPADVVMILVEKDPQHFAIVVEVEPQPYIIHASNMTGFVIKTRLDEHWRKRVLRAYRYRGIQ